MGLGSNKGTVYAIDFGLAMPYWHALTGSHIRSSTGHELTGTARYASINAYLGGQQSRRDNLEAVA